MRGRTLVATLVALCFSLIAVTGAAQEQPGAPRRSRPLRRADHADRRLERAQFRRPGEAALHGEVRIEPSPCSARSGRPVPATPDRESLPHTERRPGRSRYLAQPTSVWLLCWPSASQGQGSWSRVIHQDALCHNRSNAPVSSAPVWPRSLAAFTTDNPHQLLIYTRAQCSNRNRQIGDSSSEHNYQGKLFLITYRVTVRVGRITAVAMASPVTVQERSSEFAACGRKGGAG